MAQKSQWLDAVRCIGIIRNLVSVQNCIFPMRIIARQQLTDHGPQHLVLSFKLFKVIAPKIVFNQKRYLRKFEGIFFSIPNFYSVFIFSMLLFPTKS